MVLYSSWVHGNSALLERNGSPGVKGKSSILSSFRGETGDIVYLGGEGSAACVRMGWGSRFVVFDSGSENYEKSGSFWCHFAIPTPVIEEGSRAQADTVLINYESSDRQALNISAVTVWDGNRRIFADENPIIAGDDFDGGIPNQTSNSGIRPNLSRLWRGNISRQPIYFGVQVSLQIRAQRARDDILEVRSVGVDFQLPR